MEFCYFFIFEGGFGNNGAVLCILGTNKNKENGCKIALSNLLIGEFALDLLKGIMPDLSGLSGWCHRRWSENYGMNDV